MTTIGHVRLSITFICWTVTLFNTLIYCSQPPLEAHLRIASFNVRYDRLPNNESVQDTISNLPKGLPSVTRTACLTEGTGVYGAEKPWSARRIKVANEILWSGAVVYGGQELLIRQVMDMEELLGPTWSRIGIGRDDGKQAGEFNPIFYRKDILALHTWDTFWLSDSPFEPTKEPTAGSYRICTCAHFTHRTTGLMFTHINTHLDDSSPEARRLGASLILHRAHYEAVTHSHPVLLTGDFNSDTASVSTTSVGTTSKGMSMIENNDPTLYHDREKQAYSAASKADAYEIITGAASPVSTLNTTFLKRFSWHTGGEDGHTETIDDRDQEPAFASLPTKFTFHDLLARTPPHRRIGNTFTFTDFASSANISSSTGRLDYIFAGSSSSSTTTTTTATIHNENENTNEIEIETILPWRVDQYRVSSSLYDDCVYASDHRAVFADLVLVDVENKLRITAPRMMGQSI